MTVRERVFASRLIERIDSCDMYAVQIGLSGNLNKNKDNKETIQSTAFKKHNKR